VFGGKRAGQEKGGRKRRPGLAERKRDAHERWGLTGSMKGQKKRKPEVEAPDSGMTMEKKGLKRKGARNRTMVIRP